MMVQEAIGEEVSFQYLIGTHPLRLANPDFSVRQQRDKVTF